MSKPLVIRTLGRLPFEELSHERFEDLIRDLIYDFRDWKDIQGVGRAGSDDGNDIIAFEKINSESMDEINSRGRRWMVQAKRYKTLTPGEVKKILKDVNKQDVPYGYILAASANISKKTREVFDSVLHEKGVMEFYIWGKSELEGMLHMPKNDSKLFTFFGISLIAKQRKYESSIKRDISIKNKLFKILGGHGGGVFEDILIRDVNDENYPYESNTHDAWKDFRVIKYHPLGLIIEVKRRYAYLDLENREYDVIDQLNLDTLQKKSLYKVDLEAEEKKRIIQNHYELLPLSKQAMYIQLGFLSYRDILIIDEEGDYNYKMPHVYVDYSKDRSFFSAFIDTFEIHGKDISGSEIEGLKKIAKFPDTFKECNGGKTYKDNVLKLPYLNLPSSRNTHEQGVIFDILNEHDNLNPLDKIGLCDRSNNQVIKILITNKSSIEISKIKSSIPESIRNRYDSLIANKVESNNTNVTLMEFKVIYDFEK